MQVLPQASPLAHGKPPFNPSVYPRSHAISAHLCTSGGSLWILELASTTSLATLPLQKDKNTSYVHIHRRRGTHTLGFLLHHRPSQLYAPHLPFFHRGSHDRGRGALSIDLMKWKQKGYVGAAEVANAGAKPHSITSRTFPCE